MTNQDVNNTDNPIYPFSAVVGLEDAKLALILNAIDPSIGGVLLRGERGSAKTTLARSFAQLLGGKAKFCEIPLGATEDRVVGSLDLKRLLDSGELEFRNGILAEANGGVVYVDEVNLLAHHLVDVLLDVSASGINRVERDGVSFVHPARFVLIGSMNPEEGDVRPQLLDRFGMSVTVSSETDLEVRREIVTRRLSFEASPRTFVGSWSKAQDELSRKLANVSRAKSTDGPVNGDLGPELDPRVIQLASKICIDLGIDGMRGDLVICKAAQALSRWEGRDRIIDDDVRRVAPLVLGHRVRKSPLDTPESLASRLSQVIGNAMDRSGATKSQQSAEPIGVSRDGIGHTSESGPSSVGPNESIQSHREPDGGSPKSDPTSGAGQDVTETSGENVSGVKGPPERSKDKNTPKSPGEVTLDNLIGFVNPGAKRFPGALSRSQDNLPTRDRVSNGQAIKGGRNWAPTSIGRQIGARQPGVVPGSIALLDTLFAMSTRRANQSKDNDQSPPTLKMGGGADIKVIEIQDLREKVYEQTAKLAMIFVVDTSYSMGAQERIDAVKETISFWLLGAYAKRIAVGLVTFNNNSARVVLEPTSSIEIAKKRLDDIEISGKTPLAEGLRVGSDLAMKALDQGLFPVCLLFSDARATSSAVNMGGNFVDNACADPFAEACSQARSIRKSTIPWIVVSHAQDDDQLGLIEAISQELGAQVVEPSQIYPGSWS